nr:hypothetical protein [Tanacetum cinerariifolium]
AEHAGAAVAVAVEAALGVHAVEVVHVVALRALDEYVEVEAFVAHRVVDAVGEGWQGIADKGAVGVGNLAITIQVAGAQRQVEAAVVGRNGVGRHRFVGARHVVGRHQSEQIGRAAVVHVHRQLDAVLEQP